jgi:hypothetical protein
MRVLEPAPSARERLGAHLRCGKEWAQGQMGELDEAALLRMGKVVSMKLEFCEMHEDISEAVQQGILVVLEGHAAPDE